MRQNRDSITTRTLWRWPCRVDRQVGNTPRVYPGGCRQLVASLEFPLGASPGLQKDQPEPANRHLCSHHTIESRRQLVVTASRPRRRSVSQLYSLMNPADWAANTPSARHCRQPSAGVPSRSSTVARWPKSACADATREGASCLIWLASRPRSGSSCALRARTDERADFDQRHEKEFDRWQHRRAGESRAVLHP